MKVQKFKRGQIWWYETGTNYNGSIPGKTRPVVIISNELANEHSTCLLGIPCTTAAKNDLPTHTSFYIDGTFSTALAENMLAVNKEKLTDYIGTVDDELLKSLELNVSIALGLTDMPAKQHSTSEEIKIKERPLTFEQYVANKTFDKIEEVEPVFEDNSPLEEKLSTRKAYEGVGKKGHQKYTREDMIRFINDCENHAIEWVTKKYNCTSEKATSNKLYRFRKFLKENP